METLRRIARYGAIALLLAAPVSAADNGTLCTLAFDGLAVGISAERNVVAMYGQGYFDPKGGDTGARYYTDKNHSTTLAIEFGADKIIASIVYRRGLHLPSGVPKDAAAKTVSRALDHLPSPYAVSLGMTKATVAELGRVQAQSGNTWIYVVGGIGCDRSGAAELTFDKGGKLDKIELSIAPDE